MDATTETTTLVGLEQEALTVQADLTVKIVDQPSYDLAVEKRTQAANWLRDAKEWFKGMKDPAYAAWKKICTNENTVCDPVENRLRQLNSELARFDQEQERIRREEERRLREEAEAKAREEALANAIQAESDGADEETVTAIVESPAPVTERIVAPPTYEKSKQVVYRDSWAGECHDLLSLVKYVAKNKQHLNLLQVNQPALTQLARALKDSMDIPGVRAVNNKVVATGRG